METKKCTKCGEVKLLELFRLHKFTKDIRSSACLDCNGRTREEGERRRRQSRRARYKEAKSRLGAAFPHKTDADYFAKARDTLSPGYVRSQAAAFLGVKPRDVDDPTVEKYRAVMALNRAARAASNSLKGKK